jgi:hypothetical protein
MHDWTLQSLIVDWGNGEVRVSIRAPDGQTDLRAAGLQELRIPRAQLWGQSSSINTVEGPIPLQNGLSCLKIEMQSGDQIEIVAGYFEMPGRVRNPG